MAFAEVTSGSSVSDDFPVGTTGVFLPNYGNLETFYGNLETFYGNLETFEGSNAPQYGNLETFYGNLETFAGLNPSYGNLETFYGNLETFYGNLETFLGVNPQYGNLETFYGNLETFETATPYYGNLETFYGNLETFYGNLETFIAANPQYGNLETFYGNLETFYGNLETFLATNPQYGNLETFYGNLETFYGNLETFLATNPQYGNLETFYGNLETFYGNLETFLAIENPTEQEVLAFYGNLETFYGNLETFHGNLESFYGNLETFYGNLETFYGNLETFWGDLGGAYGNLETFWDGLVLINSMDRIDHWMGPVNWSPALTQDHDFKSKAVIGLLDFGITDDALLTNDIVYSGGYDTEDGDTHGSSVISLMIAPHDGEGVMGIAPNASVATYNPFDETKTASFEDVETGIHALVDHGARIINMSLGVPNTVLSSEWSDILDGVVSDRWSSRGTIFVKSAGNDGAVQTDDIDWTNTEALSRLILVGALDITGSIAQWSNTPGEACALINGVCYEENKLKYNFIVAPGEYLLVSDGEGGVMRQSGTSFAAPLVSGTAALIHGYWPWWKNYGEETVDVILKSATDLGEEGVDEVYGWGLLNVEAALSPLDWEKLRFYSSNRRGFLNLGMSARSMQRTYLRSNTLKLQENNAYIVGIERVGRTYRDFRIPLSTNLFGATSTLHGMANERRFQRHLYQRFADWATGASFGDTNGLKARIGKDSDWSMYMTARPYAPGTDIRDGDLPFQSDITLAQAKTGTEFRFGYGDGVSRLASSKVFSFYSDFNVETGGVNPVLGLASGGSYAAANFQLNDRMSVSAAVTENSFDHTYIDPITGLRVGDTVEITDFSAAAANVSFGYQLTNAVRVNLDYTQLHEANSLLGDQGSGLFALDGGATTDSMTVGTEVKLPMAFTFATSATFGKTRETRFDSGFLSVDNNGLDVSGFAVGLLKEGVFGKQDRFRLSLSQPLQVENGTLNFTALEVVDRETGELGEVTQAWSLDQGSRELNVEAIYAVPVLDGAGQFMAFTKSGTSLQTSYMDGESELSFGARFVLQY